MIAAVLLSFLFLLLCAAVMAVREKPEATVLRKHMNPNGEQTGISQNRCVHVCMFVSECLVWGWLQSQLEKVRAHVPSCEHTSARLALCCTKWDLFQC